MARREDPGEDLHTPTGRASKNGSRGRAQDMLREEESCPSCRRGPSRFRGLSVRAAAEGAEDLL